MEEIDFENLDLKSMTPEEIVSLEKEYLINVLGKNLIDSEERDDRKNPTGYRVLAMKYWPEEFEGEEKKCVHHIDFNHSNNIVSNLVVLTYKEHKLIHRLFDPDYEEYCNNISESQKGKPKGPCSEECKKKISEALKDKPKGPCSEEHKNKLSESHKGKTHTEETKKKISESTKGKPKGPCSEEHKNKLSESLKRKHQHK